MSIRSTTYWTGQAFVTLLVTRITNGIIGMPPGTLTWSWSSRSTIRTFSTQLIKIMRTRFLITRKMMCHNFIFSHILNQCCCCSTLYTLAVIFCWIANLCSYFYELWKLKMFEFNIQQEFMSKCFTENVKTFQISIIKKSLRQIVVKFQDKLRDKIR